MTAPLARCPCCDAPGAEALGTLPDRNYFAGKRLDRVIPGGWLYRCGECQLKFRYPLQPIATYHALYDNAETATWPIASERPDWDLIVEQVAALCPRGGRVLDFGCYTGGLLARLQGRYELFGVEVNREAGRIASEATGARVWMSLEDIPDGQRFDLIVLADVIEHVPDPRALLESLQAWLSGTGAIIVTTGDADNVLWNRFGANWWYCFYPEHIAFISRTWVERALCPRGWSLLHARRFRYARLGTARRLLEGVAARLYGWLPDAYLYVGTLLRRWSGRDAMSSVPGSGVSEDHLLIVVSPRQTP